MKTEKDIKLAVVLPAYNEAKDILSTLDALRIQSDENFDVVFVDNNSTDGTSGVIEDFIETHQLDRWTVITEIQKGTGVAADTGMRYAAAQGATHLARTDTDCVPRTDWVAQIKAEFLTGTRFIAGRITPRRDQFDLPNWKYNVLDGAVVVAGLFGKVRPSNMGKQYHGFYIMTAGCNIAIESALYIECGGFPRSKIEDIHEDRALINNVRRYTKEFRTNRNIVVYTSARRVQEWGLWNTLMWYKDHSYKPEVVDIR